MIPEDKNCVFATNLCLLYGFANSTRPTYSQRGISITGHGAFSSMVVPM